MYDFVLATLIVLAIFQAVMGASPLPLTLIYTAFFSLALFATNLDFIHSLAVNSLFCYILAKSASAYYENDIMVDCFVYIQMIAIINYICMGLVYSFLGEFYTKAITLYNSFNDALILLNIAVLIGMMNGGSRVRNRVA